MANGAGVTVRNVVLPTYDGSTVEAFVAMPPGAGPHPAIVLGQEAMGPNQFNRQVVTDLAGLGYVAISPDYFRGTGPSQPDNYEDFGEVMASINALDFGRATHDLFAAADWLRADPAVDPARIGVWGYCTGGTLALLAAELDRRFAACVVFFPSQPHFEELTAARPVQPYDLLWNIAGPLLMIYGDADPIMPPDLLADYRRRLEQWNIAHDIQIYPGAGHAFSAPAPHMHDASASTASWAHAAEFIAAALRPAG